MTADRNRRLLVLGVKYVLGFSALAWVLSLGDWHEIVALLGQIDRLTLVQIGGITGFEFGVRLIALYALLNTWKQTGIRTVWNIDLGSKFINHLLPSRVAGQGVLPLLIRHWTTHTWGQAMAVTTYNIGVQAVFVGLATLVGIVTFGPTLPGWLLAVIAAAGGLYLVVGLVTFSVSLRFGTVGIVISRIAGAVSTLPIVGGHLSSGIDGVAGITETVVAPFYELLTTPRIALAVISSTAGVHMIAPGIRVWLLLGAFGAPFSPAILLPVALVTAYSVTLLPITPGGIGVAETSATVVLIALGIPEEVAIGAVLVDRFLGVYFPALLGWIPMISVDLPAETGLRE